MITLEYQFKPYVSYIKPILVLIPILIEFKRHSNSQTICFEDVNFSSLDRRLGEVLSKQWTTLIDVARQNSYNTSGF